MPNRLRAPISIRFTIFISFTAVLFSSVLLTSLLVHAFGEHQITILLICLAIVLFLTLSACYWLSARILKPIHELNAAARQLVEGKWDNPLSYNRYGELSELEEMFNQMANKLQNSFSTLEHSLEALQFINQDLSLSASVFQASCEAIVITDSNNKIIRVNKAYVNLTGFMEEEALGKDPNILRSGRHERLFYQNMWKAIATVGYWSGEVWNRRKTGDIFPGWLSIHAVKGGQGEIANHIGVLTDNTHQKMSRERLYHLSRYDALTGLPNQRLFEERLEQTIAHAKRNHTQIALLCVDINAFKSINEALGHAAGDQLLQSFAQRILDHCRDSVETPSRLSADEFAFTLESQTDDDNQTLQQTLALTTRILASLKAPFHLEDQEVVIGASIGIAIFPQDGQNTGSLLNSAQTALHKAKQPGELNGYRFFTKSMYTTVHKRLNLQSDLRQALERGQLSLHYQPQVEIHSERIIGAEALLRWEHPILGRIAPTEFISIAEESGLIIPIGAWVLQTACEQNKQWQNEGLGPIRIAVNLSARQFHDSSLLPHVRTVLAKTGLSAADLELEITESMMMSNINETLKILRELHALGVDLAIDDFGTGYSSLNYLKQFPLDTLKIDASFVREIRTPGGFKLVSAIINMAHSLDLVVVTEGIETEEELEILKQSPSEWVQGYYFSRPLPATDFAERVLEQRERQTLSKV